MSKFTPTFFSLLLFIGLFSVSVDPVYAQGFVNCEGTNCSACNLAEMGNTILQWLIGVMLVVFGLIMAIAGIQLVTSGGNPSAMQSAKDKLTNALIGLIIILAAWLIVDTVMRALLSTSGTGVIEGYGFWAEVECQEQGETSYNVADRDELGIPGLPAGTPVGVGVVTGPVGQATSNVSLSGELGTYEGRQFDNGIIENVQYIHENFGLRVSGGHRTPERNAQVNGSETSYHLSGRAADFVGTQSEMQAARDWANANGASEVMIHDAGTGTHLHVAW